MKIAGVYSSHDCAFAILEDGIPTVHAELERYLRVKEPVGDAFKFLTEEYKDYKDIKYYSHTIDTYKGGPMAWYPDSLQEMIRLSSANGGKVVMPGHHKSHAANAFFSSNHEDALIITLDGGGRDVWDGQIIPTAFTVWEGRGNKIKDVAILHEEQVNVGIYWAEFTEEVFGLSRGYPKGNQCGTVMAMACMGNPDKYHDYILNHQFKRTPGWPMPNYKHLKQIAEQSEQNAFDIAAGLQKATETFVRKLLEPFVKKSKSKNLCLSGGVVLNSVMVGKMREEWYKDRFDNIYVCPVPYDSGLAIGSAQYVWHHHLENPRIKWEDNATPYLGFIYEKQAVMNAIESNTLKVTHSETTDKDVALLLDKGKIVSVFGGGSESGRRALGNRSILADPRNPNMKDIINEKVKHRQWYRPFAPSILRESVKDWFYSDISSPYMSFVLKFKEEVRSRVPAVVHFDGSARLQTVTERDNKWYYNFIKTWEATSGVPILLNTSFNDREPIVETPEHAIACFLKTDIDYLYFTDYGILVSKRS